MTHPSPEHSSPSRHPSPKRRFLLGALLAFGLAFLGLAAGTFLGGQFLVPEGSGMAGPVIALGYGLLGALVGIAVALLVIWRVSTGALQLATVVVSGLSLVLVGALIWRVMDLEKQRRAKYGLDEAFPPNASWTLVSRLPDSLDKRSYRELEIAAARWEFRYSAVGPEAASCTGELNPREAQALASWVEGLGERPEGLSEACLQASSTEPAASITLLRTEPAAELEIHSTRACRAELPGLTEIMTVLYRVPLDALTEQRVSCE